MQLPDQVALSDTLPAPQVFLIHKMGFLAIALDNGAGCGFLFPASKGSFGCWPGLRRPPSPWEALGGPQPKLQRCFQPGKLNCTLLTSSVHDGKSKEKTLIC